MEEQHGHDDVFIILRDCGLCIIPAPMLVKLSFLITLLNSPLFFAPDHPV
jgi:hypothetical protein